jgi:hypothetical protein
LSRYPPPLGRLAPQSSTSRFKAKRDHNPPSPDPCAGAHGIAKGDWIGDSIFEYSTVRAHQRPLVKYDRNSIRIGFVGLVYGIFYLVSGRNLWVPINAHGLTGTTSFILLYLSQLQ